MLAVLMLLLIPFMQLGVSYYASINAVLLLLVLAKWGPDIIRGAARANLLLAIALLMALPLITAPSLDFRDDMLRTLREAVMFVILAAGLTAFRAPPAKAQPQPPLIVFTAVIGLIFVVCAIQTVLLPRGVYFGFPETMFAQESGTIATDEALRYGGEVLRPQATFSEPSYMGFVLLSFAMMILPRTASSRWATMLMGIILVTGLLGRSLSFLLAMAGVILLPLMLERRANRGLIIAGSAAIALLTLSLTSAAVLVTRLFDTRSVETTDMSTLARVNQPLQVIPDFIAAYPGGVPSSAVERAMLPFMPDTTLSPAEILNNAVFNMLFLYGIAGLLLIGVLIFLAKDLRTRLYVLACAMFNGAFLAIDKVAMILLTIALYESARKYADELRATPSRRPSATRSRWVQRPRVAGGSDAA